MTQKVIVAVICSFIVQVIGFFMFLSVGFMGSPTTPIEDISAGVGSLLFWGAPFVAVIYILGQYSTHKQNTTPSKKAAKTIAKPVDKKAKWATRIGIIAVLSVVPLILLAEFVSEKWAGWMLEVEKAEKIKQDEQWRQNQRNTVCVTAKTVSYDFEFGGIFFEYELAEQTLRDKAPQSVRNQAAAIINDRINPAFKACGQNQITPPVQRDQLKAAFDDFIRLADDYSE